MTVFCQNIGIRRAAARRRGAAQNDERDRHDPERDHPQSARASPRGSAETNAEKSHTPTVITAKTPTKSSTVEWSARWLPRP